MSRTHFYPWGVHSIVAVMLDLFNDFTVKRYDSDKDQKGDDIPVILKHTTKQRVLRDIQASQDIDGTINTITDPTTRQDIRLPMLNLDFTGMAPDPDRVMGKFQQRKLGRMYSDTAVTQDYVTNSFGSSNSYSPTGSFQGMYMDYMPVPWNLEFTVSLWCEFMNDAMQVIEQMASDYNPSINVKIKERGLWIPRDIKVRLDSAAQDKETEIDRTTRLKMIWDFTFTVETILWKAPQEKTAGIIEHIGIGVGTPSLSGEQGLVIKNIDNNPFGGINTETGVGSISVTGDSVDDTTPWYWVPESY